MPSSFFVNNGGSTAARTTISDDLTASAAAKSDAQKLALNAEDAQFTLSDGVTTGNSALHYNAKANASATAAAGSATTASQQAVLANDAKLAAQTAKAEAVALHTDAVQLTGDQTIAGEKTFSATVAVTSGITASGNLLVGQSGGGGNAVIAGSSSPSYTNQAGTNLLLKSGDGSGTGSSFMSFSTSPAGSSGTTVNTAVERLRIASDGQVMIGTTTEGDASADDLTVAGSGNTGITIRAGSSSSSSIYMSDATSGAGEYAGYIAYSHGSSPNVLTLATDSSPRMSISSTGVGINTSSPSATLAVSGDIHYTGSITDTSDLRLKEDVNDLSGSLDKITRLNGKSYTMVDDEEGQTEFGFIAQEVKEVFPEAVKEIQQYELDENGEETTEEVNYLGVSYVQLIAPMVEAIKELKSQNESLEARITALES